ncbi:hypothetical protein BH24GEM3_BH24GEM3_05210 [soil metagenome]
MIQEVAARLRLPEEEVDAVDEQVAGLGERVGRHLADAFPEMLLPPLPAPAADPETVIVTADAVLREAAAAGSVVLVGYAAQCIFADWRDALHIRVYAPLEHRVREIVRRLGCDAAGARRLALGKDRERSAYLRRFYGCDIDDPALYSLEVNTARVAPHDAAEMLRVLVHARAGE